MKAELRAILLEVLDELNLEQLLPECLPDDLRGAVVIALGKAAYPMARAVRGVVEVEGIAVGPEAGDVPGFLCLRGGHPYPDAGSRRAAELILERLVPLDENDVVLFLISGGGSAMIEKPIVEGLDLRPIHERLLTGSLGIVEANIVRKHLSAVKGGRLAEAAYPARQVTLYVSDVPDAHPDAVASGPTMPDPSTLENCRAIAERVGFDLPADLPETPKADDPIFARSQWRCVMRNEDALQSAAFRLSARGFEVEIDSQTDDWPVGRAAAHLLARLQALPHPAAVVAGGELQSPVQGDGIGGRNAAFVLECAKRIAGTDIVVMSAGTDGIDGNSPAAGAVADGETLARAGDVAEFELRSDAYTLFARLGDAIETGPTGNNIRDVRVLVAPA